MFTLQTENSILRPTLLVIDVQNGFVSKGGSYDKLGMNISNYRAVVLATIVGRLNKISYYSCETQKKKLATKKVLKRRLHPLPLTE